MIQAAIIAFIGLICYAFDWIEFGAMRRNIDQVLIDDAIAQREKLAGDERRLAAHDDFYCRKYGKAYLRKLKSSVNCQT